MAKRKPSSDKAREQESNGSSAPAYFLSLEIENVRCFSKKQTLRLCDESGQPAQWTVILGDNGTGKSTLLECLAAMQAVGKSGKPIESDRRPSGKHVSPAFSEFPIDLQRSFRRRNIGVGHFESYAEVCAGRGLRRRGEWHHQRRWGFSQGASPGIVHMLCSGEALGILQGLVVYAYGASRRMADATLSPKEQYVPEALEGVETLFLESVELPSAEERLLQTDYASHGKSADAQKARRRFQEMVDILVRALPDVEGLRVGTTKNGAETSTKRIEAKTPYGWVPMNRLSLGYQSMISWIADLAVRMFERYPDSKNPLEEPAIVLVDEIDLHMHPSWQRNIMEFLCKRFTNTQFVVTAHSPLVVQAAADANLVVLKRYRDHTIIHQDVEEIHGWRVDQVLTSDLFGLSSARSPKAEKLVRERRRLLRKDKMTEGERRKLERINEELAGSVAAESPDDIKAMGIVRRAARELSKKELSSK